MKQPPLELANQAQLELANQEFDRELDTLLVSLKRRRGQLDGQIARTEQVRATRNTGSK